MSVLDDPTLALIARFVVSDIDHLSMSEEAFLKNQLNEINGLIRDVPKTQQQDTVLEWIYDHAEQYREQWRKGAIGDLLMNKRCLDCPLVHNDPDTVCMIHRSWVALLDNYVSGRISSHSYINDALQLLHTHKNSLKISSLARKIQQTPPR